MRKIITQLLVILLCLPYWVCAMPVCGQEIVVSQAETPPCEAHDKLAEHQGQQTAEFMFLLDCAGVDLPLIVHGTALQKVDFKSDDSAIAGHELDLFKANSVLQANAPPTWDTGPKPLPSIILTTQRFRL